MYELSAINHCFMFRFPKISIQKTLQSSLGNLKLPDLDLDKIGSQFEKLLKAEPKNEEAIFFLAKSERMLKEYSHSTSHFDLLIKNQKSIFHDEAEWQKALNLIDEKKKDDALILLTKISKGKGKYAYSAAEMLSELND